MNTNEDGTLNYATVIDTSGIDKGAAYIEQRISEIGDSVEGESSRINELLNNIPKINLDIISNAPETLDSIQLGFQEIDRVIDLNRQAVNELESEYKKLETAAGKAFMKGDDKTYRELQKQMQAVNENIRLRKSIQKEAAAESAKLSEVEDRLQKEAQEIQKVSQQHQTLRQQIKAVKEEMANLVANGIDEQSDAYKQLVNELGRLTDIQGDIAQQGKVLANDEQQVAGVIQGLSGLSGAFSAAQGAVALFGDENEDLQRIMLKVQALMGITIGLQQVQQTLNKDSAFQLVTINKLKEYWNKLTGTSSVVQEAETAATETNTAAQAANTAATKSDTAAQTQNNTSTVTGTAAQGANTVATNTNTAATWLSVTATKAATVAMKAFKVALATTGIGLAVVAIGELVSWISSLIDKAKEADKELEEHEKLLEDGRKAYAQASVEISDYITKIEKFNGTKQQEKQLVEELNQKYGSSLGYYSSLSQWKDALKQKGEAYCRMLLKEAEAQAILNKYTEAFLNLQEVRDKAAAGEYDHWYNTKAGDEINRNKRIAEAKAEQDKWLALYKQTMQDAQAIRDNFDLNPHIDPKSVTIKGGKGGGAKFDAKAAAREYKKIYNEYVEDVKDFIKNANTKITEQEIEASGEGLIRELNDIRYSSYKKEQAWKEQLRQLAEIRKNAVKEQYLTQRGHTEDTWEQTSASKKSINDYEKELLYTPDGTQTELAKKYYEVLNGISEQGEAQIAATRQKYYDSWVQEYGTSEQKIEALTAKYLKTLNTVPSEFREQVLASWDAAEEQIKLADLKKELNWEEVFGNLDRVATASLTSLKKKLQDYVKSNKDLTPEGLKEIVDAIEKIDDKLTERNPFEALGESLDRLTDANKKVKAAQDAYNKALEDGTTDEKANAKAALESAKNVKQKALVDATNALKSTVSQIKEVTGCFDALSGALESFGIEMPEQLSGFLSGMGDALGGLESMDLKKPFSVVTGTLKTIGGIGKAIGSLFNNDGKKEKHIQNLQKQIDKLQNAYDKLGKSVDKVYSKDASRMIEQQNQMLQQQKVLIQNQIREEESKKDTDKSRIEEWRKQIEEINEVISENKEKAKDAIFGEDLKSEIENFASAYADAWAAGEDRAKSARDMVRSMMKNMVTEAIKAAIQASGAMEKIRNQLELFFSDNILSDWEQNYIMRMAENLQNELDQQFGWADSILSDEEERKGTSKGIATASQESVDENNARLTTIQEHTYTLVQGMDELNRTSSAILDKVTGIEKNTSEANTKLDNMGKSVREIKDIVDDISIRGIKLK